MSLPVFGKGPAAFPFLQRDVLFVERLSCSSQRGEGEDVSCFVSSGWSGGGTGGGPRGGEGGVVVEPGDAVRVYDALDDRVGHGADCGGADGKVGLDACPACEDVLCFFVGHHEVEVFVLDVPEDEGDFGCHDVLRASEVGASLEEFADDGGVFEPASDEKEDCDGEPDLVPEKGKAFDVDVVHLVGGAVGGEARGLWACVRACAVGWVKGRVREGDDFKLKDGADKVDDVLPVELAKVGKVVCPDEGFASRPHGFDVEPVAHEKVAVRPRQGGEPAVERDGNGAPSHHTDLVREHAVEHMNVPDLVLLDMLFQLCPLHRVCRSRQHSFSFQQL